MQIKYGLLFLVLFSSFFLANISVLVIEKVWMYLEIQAVTKAAEKKLSYETAKLDAEMQAQKMILENKLAETKKKAEDRTKKQEQLAKRNAIERERNSNAKRINKETCQFWRDSYIKNKTQKAQMMMESACKRVYGG